MSIIGVYGSESTKNQKIIAERTEKMMDGVRIRSAKDYFEEYGREKLYKQGMDKQQVKKELVDAFHKEIYDLVAMRAKKKFSDIPPEGDPEALRIAHNVVKDATKKWKKVVAMFELYRETSGVIALDDISIVPDENSGEIGFKDGELVTGKVTDDPVLASQT